MHLFPLTKRGIGPRNGKSWWGASAQESLVLCRAHLQYTPHEKNLSLPRVGQAKWKNPEHHTDAQGQPRFTEGATPATHDWQRGSTTVRTSLYSFLFGGAEVGGGCEKANHTAENDECSPGERMGPRGFK